MQRFIRTAAVLAVVLISAPAWAQEEVTATLVTIQQRQRDAQTIIMPSVTRDQIPPVEGEWFRLRLTMSLADVQNEALSWNTILEEFVPGVGWKFVTGGTYHGGVHVDPDTGQQVYPGVTFHPSQLNPAATDIRFQLSIPIRMNIGAVVETFRAI